MAGDFENRVQEGVYRMDTKALLGKVGGNLVGRSSGLVRQANDGDVGARAEQAKDGVDGEILIVHGGQLVPEREPAQDGLVPIARGSRGFGMTHCIMGRRR